MHQTIRTRTDLILFAQDNCKSYSCKRAVLTGKVVVLGGFDPIPPGTTPGWIVLVTSIHKRKWILAVIPDDARHCYHVKWLDEIPWANWNGEVGRVSGTEYDIRNGDVPLKAHIAHLSAMQERDNEQEPSS